MGAKNNISAKIIADSSFKGVRLTTMEVVLPRMILAEQNTHRGFCLAGDTRIYFDLPVALSRGKKRINYITIKDLYEKWNSGSKPRRNNPRRSLDYSLMVKDYYSTIELAKLYDFSSASSLNSACRNNKLKAIKIGYKGNCIWNVKKEDFIEYWNRDTSNSFNYQSRLSKMNIRQLNETENSFSHSTIKDCFSSGIKEIFKVTTENGFSIKSSKDHLFLTENGWKKLEDIKINEDYFIIEKFTVLEKKDPKKHKKIDGSWTAKWNRDIKKEILERQDNKCEDCCCNDPKDIHHIIPVHKNPDLAFDKTNVIALCKPCHRKRHKIKDWEPNTTKNIPAFDKVISIEYVGKEETYDLEIAGKFPNFIANGIVVHNSRNSASSRAIPFEKMVESVKNNPFIPLYWPKAHKGMVADGYYWEPEIIDKLETVWLTGLDKAIDTASTLFTGQFPILIDRTDGKFETIYHKVGEFSVSKQICNRLLEPYMYHKVLLTGDSEGFNNFFNLRCPKYRGKDGISFESKREYCEMNEDLSDEEFMKINEGQSEPHMMDLAEKMVDEYNLSKPIELEEGQYHIPYSDLTLDCSEEDKIKIAIARAARTSYTAFDSVNREPTREDLEKDIKLYEKLRSSSHWSPFEHVAKAQEGKFYNFNNFANYRYLLDNMLV